MEQNDYIQRLEPLMKEYRESFQKMSDDEFLAVLNDSTGDKRYFGLGRMLYLKELVDEVDRRGWNRCLVGGKNTFHFARRLKLINNVLQPELPPYHFLN